MKKQQYIAAVACLVAGAIGFAGVYATEKGQERKNNQQNIAQETQQTSPASYEVVPKKTVEKEKKVTVVKKDETKSVAEEKKSESAEKTKETAAKQNTLHFQKENAVWPIEGDILLDYSMDTTIYFPTLEQYRCNPAMVIGGQVNDKVLAMTRGKIMQISENEETGCTVRQDLGDGYTAVYGQLKEVNFAEGDMVEGGQVIGYVNEPTKYYATEGSNVYFSLEKDGTPVNPKDYLPEMAMNTLE
ncbi:MAG: M23 family metallopeptidase [Lachnospiraceae bacterium]|nr:M23 family metallopeptidase [Lachnospiraceae bacterium]